MTELLRCGLAFSNVDEFRSAFFSYGPGRCFVPYPDEVPEGRLLVVDALVGEQARLEVQGTVVQPDFDERGNTGVVLALDEASVAAVGSVDERLRLSSSGPVDVSGTVRRARTGKMQSALSGGAATPFEGAEGGGQEPLLEPGTTIDDRFAIEAYLASGGMGDVYRANHVHLKRPVALKLLRRSLSKDPEMWSRFQREAELVSQLESVNVVRVFDFGKTHDGQPYLAMEYVDGNTLEALLREKGFLPPAQAVEILLQVCSGLTEAHALGVVHRDLKPANIILGKRRDGAPIAKILDFGIARLADSSLKGQSKVTQMGIVIGTPAYLAPEQALAEDLDERTDVYSLGCVAFELVTGRPPFFADDIRKVITLQLTAAPPAPETIREELLPHPRLRAAILKALAKEKEHRFQTARAFSDALRDAVAPGGEEAPANAAGAGAAPAASPVAEWEEQPPATTAAPADELWPPAATSAAQQPRQAPAAQVALADDFFSNVGFSPLPPQSRAALKGLSEVLATLVDKETLQKLADAKEALSDDGAQGICVLAEVLGPPPGSPTAKACLAELLAVAADAGAFVDALEDEAIVFGFFSSLARPGGRAARAMLAMREAVSEAGARSSAKVSLRAAAVTAEFHPQKSPCSGAAAERARLFVARFKAGELLCEKEVAALAHHAVEFSALDKGEGLLVQARRWHHKRTAAAELVGREPVLETLDRRLTSLAQGVVAPVVVRGPRGSGRSALAQELAARARRRNMVVAMAHPPHGSSAQPLGAIASLLWGACGLEPEQASGRLEKTLAALGVAPEQKAAALAVAGVTQLPQPPTAGEVAYALRVVLRAGAADRPVVLLFDTLESMDAESTEVFRELVLRPSARELTIGFAAPAVAGERLGNVPSIDLQSLAAADVRLLVKAYFDATPGPTLEATLARLAEGLPGAVLDWLWWFDDCGALEASAGVLEIVEGVAEPKPDQLLRARLLALPLEARRVLEAGVLGHETFDGAQLSTAWPKVTPLAVHLAVGSRFIRTAPQRRWVFTSQAARRIVASAPSRERPAMHARLAEALIEQGKSNPASVDSAVLGEHLNQAHDGVRAAQVWRHAADAALARRLPRAAVSALRGFVTALGQRPATPELLRARAEALARAAAISLSAQDAAGARLLVDEALVLEKELGSPVPELALAMAKVLRSEARRAKAAEALARAAQLAQGTAWVALVEAERGESREQEGDLDEAEAAFEAALKHADAARDLARWHGEVNLTARLESRLATVRLQKKDVEGARQLLEKSLLRWHEVAWPPGEARVLANLGAALAAGKRFDLAVKAYGSAAMAASNAGELLFRARLLIQEARALKRHDAASKQVRTLAREAQRLAMALGWDQGQAEAGTLLE